MDARPNILELLDFLPDYLDVPLNSVTRKDGSPLVVRCLKAEPAEITRAMRALPGDRPARVADRDTPGDEDEDALLRLAPSLIEGWAAVEIDGAWVCPAFTFADPPAEGLIPGGRLRMRDVQELTLNIMRVNGYVGGRALTTPSG